MSNGADFDKCLCRHRRRRRRVVISQPPTCRVGSGRRMKKRNHRNENRCLPPMVICFLTIEFGCSASMEIGPSRPTKGGANLNKTQDRPNVVAQPKHGLRVKGTKIIQMMSPVSQSGERSVRVICSKIPVLDDRICRHVDCEFAYQYCLLAGMNEWPLMRGENAVRFPGGRR